MPGYCKKFGENFELISSCWQGWHSGACDKGRGMAMPEEES
jgi:hypothetical protein